MAAHASVFSRKLYLAKVISAKSRTLFYTPIRNAYFVLLPEVPPDSSETNSILRVGSTPTFQDLTPEKCLNGVGKLVIECEAGLCRIEESLQGVDADKVKFADVIEPLEKIIAPLDHAWSVVRHMFMSQHSEEMATVYKNLHSRVQTARARRFHSSPIHNAIKKINENGQLNSIEQRVIDKYLMEGRFNGLSLDDGALKHFNKATVNITQEKQTFRNNVNEATRRFKHRITDYQIVRDFPESLLRNMAEDSNNPIRGPWTVTLDNLLYEEFLKHCSERELRLNVWRAYNSRASSSNDSKLYNSIHMEEIRFNRQDQAKLLGFSSYAEMSMVTKMAASVDTVQSMISSLKVPSKAAMGSEIEMLQGFAEGRGFTNKLELWDIPYWRQKYRRSICGLDENEVKSYFPLQHVLAKLFEMCDFLFNIRIKDETSQVEVWNNDVTFYNVYDEKDQIVGSFFLDPYARVGKRYTSTGVDSGVNRCDGLNIKPLAYLNFNFPQPLAHLPSLLTFPDVVSLLQKFGSALQHLLTTMPYSEVSGSSNLEWDAVDVCAHFMSYWLHNGKVLQSFSCHYQTNEPLSDSDSANLIKGRQHFAAFDLMNELYLSHLDLELYSRKDFWLDINRTLWSDYFPFPLEKHNSHPCSFSSIFCDEYAASYFSFTWAKMIAADVYSAFEEIGLQNEAEIKAKGNRFRETFLALGGGCHPGEVFRMFRGRDPSPGPLLVVNGITK